MESLEYACNATKCAAAGRGNREIRTHQREAATQKAAFIWTFLHMTNMQHQQIVLLLIYNRKYCACSCSSTIFPEFLHPAASEVSAAPEVSAVPADLRTGLASQQDTCHGGPRIQTSAMFLISRCAHMVFGAPNLSAGVLSTVCYSWLMMYTGCVLARHLNQICKL